MLSIGSIKSRYFLKRDLGLPVPLNAKTDQFDNLSVVQSTTPTVNVIINWVQSDSQSDDSI